jgi:hypothetical protein
MTIIDSAEHEFIISGQNDSQAFALTIARDKNDAPLCQRSENVPQHDEALEWPQSNWTGGHGQKVLQDRTMYHSGRSIDTTQEGRILLGPLINEVYSGTTLKQSYSTGIDNKADIGGIYWSMQSFTPTDTHTLSVVSLYFAQTGGNPGTITVRVYATSGGVPTGSPISTGTTDGNTLPTYPSYEWRNVIMYPNVSLTISTVYAITVSATNSVAAGTETIRPNAAGDETNIATVYPSGSNYQAVDDVTTDDASTYVTPTIAWPNEGTQRDLYNLAAHTASGSIGSVKVYARMKRYNSTYASTAYIHVKTGSTVYTSSAKSLTSSWENYDYTWTTNPNTGIAWTWTDIDSLQAGITLDYTRHGTGGYTIGAGMCTQVWIEVNYDATFGLQWGGDASSPSYAGGQGGYSTNSGTSWTTTSGTDYYFKEYSAGATELDYTPVCFQWSSALGQLIMATSGKIYIYSTSWVEAATAVSGVLDLKEYNAKMFAACGASTEYKYSSDCSTWTTSSLTDKYANGFLQSPNPDGTANLLWKFKTPNEVTNTTDGTNTATQWVTAAYVGDTSANIQGLGLLGDELMVGRADNMFNYDSGGGVFPQMNDLKQNRSTYNFKYMCNFQSGLYFSKGTGVGELVGSSPGKFNWVGPLTDTDDIEKVGICKGLATDTNYLYVAMLENGETTIYKGKPVYDANTYTYKWNWDPWVYLGGFQCENIYVAQHSPTDRRLWFGYGTHTAYVQITDNPTTDASAKFAPSGHIKLSYNYGTNPYWDKLLQSIVIEAKGCSATETITPKYMKDTDTSVSQLASAITTDGITKTNFLNALSAKKWLIELDLATGNSTLTPQVLYMAVRGVEKPELFRTYDVTYVVTETAGLKPSTVYNWLKGGRESTTLIKFADIRVGETTSGVAGTNYNYVVMLPGYPHVIDLKHNRNKEPELYLQCKFKEVNFS